MRKFVEDAVFAAIADEETARKAKPAFINRLYQSYSARAKTELSVCVVREVAAPPDRLIESSEDFYAQGAEKVLSYFEIEKRKIDVFESGVFLLTETRRNLPGYYNPAESQPADEKASEWTEMSAGAESFAAILAGGAIHFLVAGNREKLSLKN